MPSMSLSPLTLPAGIKGTAYSQTIVASGGSSQYTYAVTTGYLPDGLSLNASSGVLSGTPTRVSYFSFTITATDSAAATASKNYNVNITAAAVDALSITDNVYKAVLEILSASQLMLRVNPATGYVQQVYDGKRDAGIPDLAMPSITLEPGMIEEIPASADSTRQRILIFDVHLLLLCEGVDAESQVLGSSSVKGILSFIKGVKTTLDAYPQLDWDGNGPRCHYFRFPSAIPHPYDYPFRAYEIVMRTFTRTTGATQH